MATIRQIVRAQARVTRNEIVTNLIRMDIRDTLQLIRSIETEGKEEDLEASIAITYNYIAKFIELGVGKGVPLPEVPASERVPRLFLTPVVERTTQDLADKLVREMGDKMIFNVFPEFD